MKKNLLVTLADKNYINHAKQLFSSVYFNAGWQGDYMLLAHEIPEKDLKWFKDKGILVKECEPIYFKKLSSGYPNTILDKFYLFTPEFKKWDNIVFLDVDIIVRYSLDKLISIKNFYAVPELNNCKLKDQFHQINKNNLLFDKLTKEFFINAPTFNIGVFAFNTKIIDENSFNKLINIFNVYEKICLYTEQSVTNLYFYKKWKRLNFFYNVYIPIMTERYHFKPSKIDGVVLHFCGKNKPWNINNPFYNEWKTNLEKAELIDLKNRSRNIEFFKINKILWHTINFYIIKTIFDVYYSIDKQIGLIGLLLKKYYPSIYFIYKKIIKK